MKKFYGNFCKIKCRKGLLKRFEKKCLAVILENLTKHIYHTFAQWFNQQSKGVKNKEQDSPH